MADLAFDLISVGGGSGGLACAQRAAEYGAKAAVVEPHRLGGTCVNVGCVPKKVMWNAAGVALSLSDANDYGFDVAPGDNDWALLKAKRDAYVLRLNGIYERNLQAKGVAYVRGTARFLDQRTLEVNGQRMSAQHIVIATGGKPWVPNLPGAELGITSDGFFELEARPQRVAVIGSGYIACELASAFRELGCQVEQFIRKERLLRNFDAMLGKSLMREVRAQGITIHEQVVPAAVRADVGPQELGGGRTAAVSAASIVCCGQSAARPMWRHSIWAKRGSLSMMTTTWSRMPCRTPVLCGCMRSAM